MFRLKYNTYYAYLYTERCRLFACISFGQLASKNYVFYTTVLADIAAVTLRSTVRNFPGFTLAPIKNIEIYVWRRLRLCCVFTGNNGLARIVKRQPTAARSFRSCACACVFYASANLSQPFCKHDLSAANRPNIFNNITSGLARPARPVHGNKPRDKKRTAQQ